MAVRRFLAHLQYEKRFSAHTLRAYESDLGQFFAYMESGYPGVPVAEINHFQIRSWIVGLIDTGVTPRSVNRKITALKSFFRFLLREKLIQQSPMVKIQSPKVPKRLPAFVDENRMTELFDTVPFEDGFKGVRDRTMLELFYGTGMRLSELINLQLKDVSFHQNTIKVLGKRNKERIIPISDTLSAVLKNYIAERKTFMSENNSAGDFLFVDNRCNKVYPKFVYRTVKRYLGSVTTGDKKNPHILRHTFATHMLNNGAEINAVKEILGHSSLAATQVYTHNTIEKLKNIYKQAHPKA
ncbi:MAG TPA: tyrosine-type recombinase/integrase [Bacteroidia bacterium]|nr:tyrosine-type recombinase/integrase [Bacteroidia bacterium]